MGIFRKIICWLIKTNMAVVSQSQKLHVNSSQRGNDGFIGFAGLFGISNGTIRHKGIFLYNIYPIK